MTPTLAIDGDHLVEYTARNVTPRPPIFRAKGQPCMPSPLSLPSRNRALLAASSLLFCGMFACSDQPRVSTPGAGSGSGGTAGITAGGGQGGSGGQGQSPSGNGGEGIKLPDASPGGTNHNDAGESPDAPTCGLEDFKLAKVPPEILLVLDRSSSMNEPSIGGAAGATLWTDALAAVQDVLNTTQASVHWGLQMFPMPNSCLVAAMPEVDVAPNNATAVHSKAMTTGSNMAGQGTGTPTDTAVISATTYLTARNAVNKNPRYIVLATDGEPTCVGGVRAMGTGAVAPSLNAIKAAVAAGFKTYVIGIAIDATGVATLNQMADAGGVPRMDPAARFYPAANKAELSAALNVITGQVSNCVFPLSKPPPAPDSVKVTVDGERVPASATDGWSYTSAMNTAIQLSGMWCEKVKTNAAQVGIVFGCPNIPIP
jgi:hypothetical protein